MFQTGGKPDVMWQMDSLTWLMVGHLVGDWLLQNDWMAQGKKQGFITLAGVAHFTIYTVTVMIALWLSGVKQSEPPIYILLAIFIFVSHWVIDATRLVDYWMKFYRQSHSFMMRMLVDQTLHIIVLAITAYIICL